jgi:ParB family chromosome partitioning protein
MMTKKRGLGKGLEALIPVTSVRPVSAEVQAGAVEIPVDQISPNPHQPRQTINLEKLQELAASIAAHGLIQPLVVTRVREGYQLIAGERRWRASQLAGLTTVPVIVKETSPQQMLELALVENIQRADLNPLEEAEAYAQLMEEFGLTQEAVAERVGKSRTAVAGRGQDCSGLRRNLRRARPRFIEPQKRARPTQFVNHCHQSRPQRPPD